MMLVVTIKPDPHNPAYLDLSFPSIDLPQIEFIKTGWAYYDNSFIRSVIYENFYRDSRMLAFKLQQFGHDVKFDFTSCATPPPAPPTPTPTLDSP